MRHILAACILWSIALGTGCTTVEPRYDVDPEMDFSTWHDYVWYPSTDSPTGHPRIDSPLFHARLERAIDGALTDRGFERLEREGSEPDFYVQDHLSTEVRLDVVELERGYGGGPRGRGWGGAGWGGAGWRETYGFEYDVGTLVIDLVDVAKRQLVWRGSGSRRLADQVDAETASERVKTAVDEILEPFPPPSAQ